MNKKEVKSALSIEELHSTHKEKKINNLISTWWDGMKTKKIQNLNTDSYEFEFNFKYFSNSPSACIQRAKSTA